MILGFTKCGLFICENILFFVLHNVVVGDIYYFLRAILPRKEIKFKGTVLRALI